MTASQLACHCIAMLLRPEGHQSVRYALLKDAVAPAVAVMRLHAVVAISAETGLCNMAESAQKSAAEALCDVLQLSSRLLRASQHAGAVECQVERWVAQWAKSACHDADGVLRHLVICE
jgi:hypothetical protein